MCPLISRPPANSRSPAAPARVFLLLSALVLLHPALSEELQNPGSGATALAPRNEREISVDGKNWPSFRNGNELRGIAKTALPKKLELLWKFETGEMVTSTPAIVDGQVYIANLGGMVFCLDLKSGEKIWSYRTKDDPNEFPPGFQASPTVTDTHVFVGDEEGTMHALDRKTGKGVWKFQTGAEIVSSVTTFGDKILFGSHDNNLYCLKGENGDQVWSFATNGPVNCTPAIVGQNTFVTGCDEHLRVIDIESGKELVDFSLGTYLIASPAVVDNLLYVGTYASEVVAIDWKAKETVWKYRNGDRELPYHSCAAVTADKLVVGGHDKFVHCIDLKTGKAAWRFPTKGKVEASPVIVGDRVFVGSQDGNFYELSLTTGKETWKFTDGRPFKGSAAVASERLVVGSEGKKGPVYCFGQK